MKIIQSKRINQTIHQIQYSIVTLMKKEKYSYILIKEICVESNISRQTFYTYFKNKDMIIYSILEDKMKQVISSIQITRKNSYHLFLKSFLEMAFEEKDFFQLLIQNDLTKLIYQSIKSFIQERLNNNHFSQEKIINYIASYLAGGLVNMILPWIEDDCTYPIEKLLKLIERIFNEKTFSQEINSIK